MARLRVPRGLALVIVGSGIYWVLSSQLIASFTVLAPELFRNSVVGMRIILFVGVSCIVVGVLAIPSDLRLLRVLLSGNRGLVFAVPMILAVADTSLTLVGLKVYSMFVELNPFVAASLEIGWTALLPFVVSYMALTEGLALLMWEFGRWLSSSLRTMARFPFSATCGAASFGPFNNLALVLGVRIGLFSLVAAATGAAVLTVLVYLNFRYEEHSTGLGETGTGGALA